VLSHARGLVQCGHCGRSFSALSFLFDEWPTGTAHGPAKGANVVPPVLLSDAAEQAADKDAVGEVERAEENGSDTRRLAWGLVAALLALVTIINATWTFREPLAAKGFSLWTQQAEKSQQEAGGLLREPQQIQLVSRDMHTHPTRAGILVLSLTFVNLAERSQVFPDLEVTLLDAANQAVAQRRLMPAEYLRDGADTAAGLATDVYLPVLLEFGDPGDQAVGFEIRFL
jgi:hypothetical protein